MLKKLRPRLTYANVVSSLCLFIVLSGGTAYATHLVVNGSDVVDESLTGADIQGKAATTGSPAVPGTLTGADLKDASITYNDIALSTIGGGRVLNDSLTGADVNESTLAEVPSAAQGGIGRSANDVYCNPEGVGFIVCAVVTLTLAAPGRVLVMGRAQARGDQPPGPSYGDCMLGSTAGPVTTTVQNIIVPTFNEVEHVPLVGVSNVLPAGQHSFGVNCEENGGAGSDGMNFYTSVSAVALSAR